MEDVNGLSGQVQRFIGGHGGPGGHATTRLLDKADRVVPSELQGGPGASGLRPR